MVRICSVRFGPVRSGEESLRSGVSEMFNWHIDYRTEGVINVIIREGEGEREERKGRRKGEGDKEGGRERG